MMLFVGHHRETVFFNRAAVLFTNRHMEHINVANGQREWEESERMLVKHHILTKAQLDNDSLLKSLFCPNSANLLWASPVHLWLRGCVALGRESIWEPAVWSLAQETELNWLLDGLSPHHWTHTTQHSTTNCCGLTFCRGDICVDECVR